MYFGPSPISMRGRPFPPQARAFDCHLRLASNLFQSARKADDRRDLERPCRLDPLAARQIFTAGLLRARDA